MNEGEDLLSSSDAARVLGVSTTSVKRWSDEGLLPCAKTAGKHRRFSRQLVEQFRAALAGRPAQPAAPPPGEIGEWVDALLRAEPPHAIETRLLRARAELGSWAAVADMMGPVLRDLGDRWARGRVSIVEEHLASERLQRALARMCEWQPVPADAPRALLATAEGDEHTLGLALVELALRERAWTTSFAGRATPTAAVVEQLASPRTRPRLVALSASASATDARALQRQCDVLGEACRRRGVAFVVGGAGAWPDRLRHGARLRRVSELVAHLG